jgi:hypothetical protein
MLLIIVMTTVVVGLIAIALAEPRRRLEIVAWNDEAERRLLRDRKFSAGWW